MLQPSALQQPVAWGGGSNQIWVEPTSNLTESRCRSDMSAECTTRVAMMRDAWTDLLEQMIYCGLHYQSNVSSCVDLILS